MLVYPRLIACYCVRHKQQISVQLCEFHIFIRYFASPISFSGQTFWGHTDMYHQLVFAEDYLNRTTANAHVCYQLSDVLVCRFYKATFSTAQQFSFRQSSPTEAHLQACSASMKLEAHLTT